jgi:hypothetical protein
MQSKYKKQLLGFPIGVMFLGIILYSIIKIYSFYEIIVNNKFTMDTLISIVIYLIVVLLLSLLLRFLINLLYKIKDDPKTERMYE